MVEVGTQQQRELKRTNLVKDCNFDALHQQMVKWAILKEIELSKYEPKTLKIIQGPTTVSMNFGGPTQNLSNQQKQLPLYYVGQ